MNDARNRLIQLIHHCTSCEQCSDGDIVDYLIANGVIVPPCKQNDVLWMPCTYKAEVHNFRVTAVSWLNGFGIVNTDTMGLFLWEDVGKTIFITRKEAEKALRGEAAKDE